ncbi:heme-degrading domain-containing protein [Mesorhizobium xinjiangense]|uniref:heme-degrading domain-containing protein n=1 Tax=Mesorhizobium xinjiangense TaxID=2678685 RepID=UPI0012EDA381|nr:heme-degrading domain-containing protein [Mesorhizobium xinjiangense]
MTVESDIARIEEQEAALVFERFDEDDAFRIGLWLRERAVADHLPIVIDIRTWDRQLFYCALPGSAGANANWVRRKINTVKLFAKSTYLIGLQQNTADGLLPARQGLDPADYVAAGGAFPIRLANAGMIGAVTVSGLPQRSDHGLVVEALCAHLDLDHAELALPQP